MRWMPEIVTPDEESSRNTVKITTFNLTHRGPGKNIFSYSQNGAHLDPIYKRRKCQIGVHLDPTRYALIAKWGPFRPHYYCTDCQIGVHLDPLFMHELLSDCTAFG